MKAQKSILSFILVIAMLLSVCAAPALAAETGEADSVVSVVFSDIDYSSVEGKAVSRLVSLGFINGYPDGTYGPAQNMTRAEFCVVMTKFKGMQDLINPNSLTGFDDIDTDENYAWARPYVKMAADLGIINGFEDGTFRAADPITYEQAVKMIICAIGYDSYAQAYMVEGDWSSGYINQANRLGITKNAGASVATKQNPTTRGIVAILLNNALDADPAPDFVNPDGSVVVTAPANGSVLETTGSTTVTGIVTGTYITETETANSTVPKDHIQIDDEIYQIGFSTNPNDLLGCKVKAIIVSAESSGDYPICRSIDLHTSNNIITIDADCYEGYEFDTDSINYTKSRTDATVRTAKLDPEYSVIYNGKLYDYDLNELENDFNSGTLELIDNNGDNRYDFVRINAYQVFVVKSKTTTTQEITPMYNVLYKGETKIAFPGDSTSLVFYMTRNGKEISFSDLAKWDVLNIKESPSDAEGRGYYEVVVTRSTVSGYVSERDSSDPTYIMIGNTAYYMSDFFSQYESDDKPEMNVGDYAQVYLDAEGKIVAAAEASTTGTTSSYAYLLGVRQESEKSDYDLEFWFYTTSGKYVQIGAAATNITIDGVKYKVTSDSVLDALAQSAIDANNGYGDASNVVYHQPVVYTTNADGLVSKIDTVNSPDNEDISAVMESNNHSEASERTYTSSSKSFKDFKVSAATSIIYVPDDRSDTDKYNTYTYSKAFTNQRSYYVEAFGLSSSKTASLVLIYGEDPSRIYTSSTPFLIVSGKTVTSSGTVIKGYNYNSTALKSITVSEDDGPSVTAIGKGDVIRYILDSSGQLIDYQIWFDASDPVQLTPCSDIADAIDSRILEIHSTSTERRTNYPSATFRLQYGTVTEIELNEDGTSVDEETITVAPTIVEDNMEMVYDGNGVVTRTIGSSVKVFYYDSTSKNSNIETDLELSEILPYSEYGDDATRVITYSASGTLRMIYIID